MPVEQVGRLLRRWQDTGGVLSRARVIADGMRLISSLTPDERGVLARALAEEGAPELAARLESSSGGRIEASDLHRTAEGLLALDRDQIEHLATTLGDRDQRLRLAQEAATYGVAQLSEGAEPGPPPLPPEGSAQPPPPPAAGTRLAPPPGAGRHPPRRYATDSLHALANGAVPLDDPELGDEMLDHPGLGEVQLTQVGLQEVGLQEVGLQEVGLQEVGLAGAARGTSPGGSGGLAPSSTAAGPAPGAGTAPGARRDVGTVTTPGTSVGAAAGALATASAASSRAAGAGIATGPVGTPAHDDTAPATHADPVTDTHADPVTDTHADPVTDTHADPVTDTHADPVTATHERTGQQRAGHGGDTRPKIGASRPGGRADARAGDDHGDTETRTGDDHGDTETRTDGDTETRTDDDNGHGARPPGPNETVFLEHLGGSPAFDPALGDELVDRLRTAGSAHERFAIVHPDRVAGLGAAAALRVLDATPEGWQRRRVAERLGAAGALRGVGSAELLSRFPRASDTAFVAGAALDDGSLRLGDLEGVVPDRLFQRLRIRARTGPRSES